MARQGLCECTSGFYSLLKWIVILVNIVLWLFGIAVLAVGIWLYIVSNEYSAIAEGRYLVGSVLLITSGFSVIVIGFLGFVGAIFESTIVLIVYAILIAIASILQLAAGGWAVNQLNSVSFCYTCCTRVVCVRSLAPVMCHPHLTGGRRFQD
jgi:hypothetical protein